MCGGYSLVKSATLLSSGTGFLPSAWARGGAAVRPCALSEPCQRGPVPSPLARSGERSNSGRVGGQPVVGPMRTAAPRIYDLYPLLAGPIYTWREDLPRIAGMGVDWVYVNAFWTPRASGSIYAIADPYELHPLVRGDSREDAATLVRWFVEAAREHGLKVMLDLVVPHVAREARLVKERPDWFRWQDGQPAAPVLANPTDPRHPRHMSDLAELELGRRELWPAQADYVLSFIRHYLDL